MKLIITLALLLNLNTKTDVIELTVTGSGITKDLAIQNALRNSLEQSFGAFISSKTEILNDVMIKDEITSISTGNVVDFKVISHVKNQDLHSVVVKSNVSLSSFSNYIQSKGHNVVFDSESFSLKIKLQEFNIKSEEKAVKDILVVFKKMVKKSIEFKVLIEEPLFFDTNTNKYLPNTDSRENVFGPNGNKNFHNESRGDSPLFKSTGLNDIYTFDIKVVYGANKSLDEAYEYLNNSLTSLSMSEFDVESYKRINRPLYYLKLLKTEKNNNDFFSDFGITKTIEGVTKYLTKYFNDNVDGGVNNEYFSKYIDQLNVDFDEKATILGFGDKLYYNYDDYKEYILNAFNNNEKDPRVIKILKDASKYNNYYGKVDYRSIYDINLDMSDRVNHFKELIDKQINYKEIVLRSQMTADLIVDALYEVNEYIFNFKLKFSNYEFTPNMYIKTSSLFDDLDYNNKADGQTYKDYLEKDIVYITSDGLYSKFKLTRVGLPGLNVYDSSFKSYTTSIYYNRLNHESHKHRINQYTSEYTTRQGKTFTYDFRGKSGEEFHTNKEIGVPNLKYKGVSRGEQNNPNHFYHNYSVYIDLQGLSNIGEIEVINLN